VAAGSLVKTQPPPANLHNRIPNLGGLFLYIKARSCLASQNIAYDNILIVTQFKMSLFVSLLEVVQH
jgi:hypothetical protein